MNEGVVYALISLLFAGVNDTLFKRQAISGQCRGQYMIIVGSVWALVFSVSALCHGGHLPNSTTILFGLIVGLFSASANYLLIYSMQTLEAGIAATIYRLNLAVAVLLALVFLNENIYLTKMAGILMAIVAIMLFFPRLDNVTSNFRASFLVAIMASVLRALMGIGYKVAITKGVSIDWFLAVSGICWIMLGTMGAFRRGGEYEFQKGNMVRGTISGLLICGIVFFFARALAKGQASVVIPITQMSFIVTTLLAWFIWRERMTLKAIAGLVLACFSILMLGI
jgi:bacterial/archaeal transporter family protein